MAEQKAFCMDCMEAMKQMPDKAWELAIVDPPYGLERFKHGGSVVNRYGDEKGAWNNTKPSEEYFNELFRVSKNQIIWGANHFISRMPFDSSCWIVWDKMNGENDFADCELAWTSFSKAVRQFTFRWAGMLQGNMANKEIRIHPTQKPVALYEWLLTHYAKPGDRILDTHLGSGSSRIAAYNLGFDFVGCEIDEYYFKKQEERFARHTAQGNLFLELERSET